MSWRLITDDGVSASFGLAADEALSPPTLRLYTYRSTCALVGRFQNVAREIHVDFCRDNSVAINRRPTGGGAIVMGADQLGVALRVPALPGRTRELMGRFSEGVVAGLSDLGIEACFRGKNDLEVDGRKIAGLGLHRDLSGGLLFHASVLVDLDVRAMLRILKTPFEKITDKEIATVAGRTTTVRKTIGRELPLEDVRSAVASGFARAWSVTLTPGAFTDEERAAIDRLETEKYGTEAWVFQTTLVPDAAGSARVKTPGGLLDVHVSLVGRMIKAVYIRGDFFAPESAVADLEARLRWHPATPEAVAQTVRSRADEMGIPPDALIEAILAAAQQADPYGCFVKADG